MNDFDFPLELADVNVFIEIHRPRVASRDMTRLKAGPRENQ